jgi:hypothetical protein
MNNRDKNDRKIILAKIDSYCDKTMCSNCVINVMCTGPFEHKSLDELQKMLDEINNE